MRNHLKKSKKNNSLKLVSANWTAFRECIKLSQMSRFPKSLLKISKRNNHIPRLWIWKKLQITKKPPQIWQLKSSQIKIFKFQTRLLQLYLIQSLKGLCLKIRSLFQTQILLSIIMLSLRELYNSKHFSPINSNSLQYNLYFSNLQLWIR